MLYSITSSGAICRHKNNDSPVGLGSPLAAKVVASPSGGGLG